MNADIRHTRRRAGALAGFTLVEVMLAVAVLGLGILGLFALFAGSAKQQVDSARVNFSIRAVRSAETVIRDRIGPLTRGQAANLSAPPASVTTNGQYARIAGALLHLPPVDSLWYPMSAYPARANQSQVNNPEHALAVAPSIDPVGGFPLGAFFLVRGDEVTLFHNPWQPLDRRPAIDGPAGPPYGDGTASATSAGIVFDQFNNPVAPFNGGGNPQRAIRPLPHARLHPGSLRIRIDIGAAETPGSASFNPNSNTNQYKGSRSISFSDMSFAGDGDNFTNPGIDPVSGSPGLLTNWLRSDDGSMRLLFDRVMIPNIATPPTGPTKAFISAFQPAQSPDVPIPPLAVNEWVERIVVEPYVWRNDRLLTLEQRVTPAADGQSATGIALMFQRVGPEWRIGMLTYTAEAQGAAGASAEQLRFIPPESGTDNGTRLLANVGSVDLRYDRALRRFYLRTDVANDAFAVAQGQIVMICGDIVSGSVPPRLDAAFVGATDFTRIQRGEVRVVGGTREWRGYIDGSPRRPATSAAPAGPFLVEPDLAATNDPQPVPVRLWAMRPLVRGLPASTGVQPLSWRITAVEGRVIRAD